MWVLMMSRVILNFSIASRRSSISIIFDLKSWVWIGLCCICVILKV